MHKLRKIVTSNGSERSCILEKISRPWLEMTILYDRSSSYSPAHFVDYLTRTVRYCIAAPGDMSVRADQDEVAFVDFAYLFIVHSNHLERNSGSLRGIRETGRGALCESD